MDNLFSQMNSNPLFSGCLMLLMNIGGKYVNKDIPKTVEIIFNKNYFMRILVVFAIGFIATHDIKIALVITLIFIVIFGYLLNEKKSTNIMKGYIDISDGISKEEYLLAKKIVFEYERKK